MSEESDNQPTEEPTAPAEGTEGGGQRDETSQEEQSHDPFSAAGLQCLMREAITRHAPLRHLDIIIRSGGDPNKPVTKGLRPLHYAVYEDNQPAMRFLLELGVDVNASDDVGFTPLHLAAKYGRTEAARLLLERGALASFQGDATEGITEMSRSLAELSIDPINLAVENDHADIVKLLLKAGVSPNNHYFLGSEINIIDLSHTACLELLLSHGADPDAVGRGGLTPLMRAVKEEAEGAVRLLLHYGANVNQQPPSRFEQRRAIYFAASNGNVSIFQLLLDAGAAVGRAPDYDYSPLEVALCRGHIDICGALLRVGADPNELNAEMSSPLQVACSYEPLRNRYIVSEMLLRHGAEPNFYSGKYSYIGPSLCPVVEYLTSQETYHSDFIRLLLRYGASVNFRRCRKFSKVYDASGILEASEKLVNYRDVMALLLEAAEYYDITAIRELPERQRHLLETAASTPRTLLQQARTAIRACCPRPLPPALRTLPLPRTLIKFLLFQ